LYKETIRDEEITSTEQYAKTIQEIQSNTTKPKNNNKKDNIFFQHPLKTMDASLQTIQGRGFKHLSEAQKDKNHNSELQIDTQKAYQPSEDAPMLKDITKAMNKLELQK
jgi:hypothetical protein